MIQNPHLVCARVLDTIRVSGLTYSLVCMRRPILEGSTQSFTPQPDHNFSNFKSQLSHCRCHEAGARYGVETQHCQTQPSQLSVGTLESPGSAWSASAHVCSETRSLQLSSLKEELSAEVEKFSQVKVQCDKQSLN